MILSSTVDCIAQPVAEKASTAMQCTGEIVMAVSPWDMVTTIANTGILLIALGALAVSAFARRDAKIAMEQTLDANYNATEAQLKATREATAADLKERQNSRELDATASFLAATDELILSSQRRASTPERVLSLMEAHTKAQLASGRFRLIVGEAQEIGLYYAQYLQLIQSFSPTSPRDFETIKYKRLIKVHAILQMGITEYQKDRSVPDKFAHIRAALQLGRLEILDQLLGTEAPEVNSQTTDKGWPV